MKLGHISKNKKFIILTVLIVILVFSYLYLCFYNFKLLNKYDGLILPNTYVGNYDVSYFSYDYFEKKMDDYSEEILNQKVKFNINSTDCEYSFKDMGITVDNKKVLDDIKKYQDGLSKARKLIIINSRFKHTFNYNYIVDDEKLRAFLANVKATKDVGVADGHFDDSEGVKYVKGVDGFSLNVDESYDIIKSYLDKSFDGKEVITLKGDITPSNNNSSYETIDTMTSSFSTVFMPNTYLRNINLNTALGYINGVVVEPGEIFSYCKYAGPFNKAGYVFYYEFVGNGVCQIATTTYNAALLGGLEIVKRYPHDKKSLYVDGGLDATVASYSSGWCVDMQFKNTYDYPIYIKAFSYEGVAYVEFWSNSNAKKGREYSTSSQQIGYRGYRSFLHTYENGQEIDVHEIDTTWYLKD